MDLYFKKKEQLNAPINKIVADATIEIEKKRALSPAPRSSSVIRMDKKVMYKTDLDDIKAKLNVQSDSLNKQVNSLNADMNSQFAEIQKIVNSLSKNIESTKIETLKDSLNNAVKQQNDNMHKFSDELILHLNRLNELESRLLIIEGCFE